MLTLTGRKHIIRALREALAIRECTARDLLYTVRNHNALRLLDGVDLRTVKALVGVHGLNPEASLYVDEGHGYEHTGVTLRLEDEHVERWNRMSLEDAYAIAADVNEKAGPRLRAADDRMAAEAAAMTLADNDDLLPEEAMDQVYGTAPEPREYDWKNGMLLRADIASAGDHVVALVELADGERRTMAMFPLFSGPADLLSYAQSKIGTPARLCVARVGIFDNDVPAGFDRSMPVLDMIVPESDVPGLVRTLRRAA